MLEEGSGPADEDMLPVDMLHAWNNLARYYVSCEDIYTKSLELLHAHALHIYIWIYSNIYSIVKSNNSMPI